MTSTAPRPLGRVAHARAAAITGAQGHLIGVQAEIGDGPPGVRVLGLPDAVTRTTGERVRAAVLNAGHAWPARPVTISLGPPGLPGHGIGLDLAIAVAVLAAAGTIPLAATGDCVLAAELGLDGGLRPVRGVLPALLAATAAGCNRAVVATASSAEAVMAPGMTVVPCDTLSQVLAWLHGQPLPPGPRALGPAKPPAGDAPPALSPASPAITPAARIALEACAAGGHHLCLTGPRGAAIQALAGHVAGMLPPLTTEQALQASAAYSVAGLLGPGRPLITRPPLRAPHHTATSAAILGGGTGPVRPGEAALAHHGLLFLADAPEFAAPVLAGLRQALQHRQVVIARHGGTVTFPARFTLITAMTPCSCGRPAGCACTTLQARRYQGRITSQLGTWIQLRLTVPGPASPDHHTQPDPAGQAASAGRVATARERARHRFRGLPWQLNADIPGGDLRRSFPPEPEALGPLRRAADLGEISIPALDRILRVAWTLADLAGASRPGPDQCGQALAFYLGVSR